MSQQPLNDLDRFIYDLKKNIKLIGPIAVLVLIVASGKTAFYTVDPDEEAVIIRFGKYISTNPPGLHFKLPFGIDQVFHVRTKRVLQEEFGFRTNDTRGRRTSYSQSNFEDESLMLTGDLNVAEVEWVVQYQISDPFKYIFQTNNPTQNIRDVSESIMRRVVGDRLVTEVLTTGRVEIASEGKILMQEILNKYDLGVKIVTVKLQDVNPPKAVKESFNEVNKAKQEQEKVINEAEENYNRIIPEARGKAERAISEAQGYSLALVNRAKGDASKFNALLAEYLRAPKITKKRIYLETMEGIFQRLEDMTIIDPKIKGLLPVYGQSLSKKDGL